MFVSVVSNNILNFNYFSPLQHLNLIFLVFYKPHIDYCSALHLNDCMIFPGHFVAVAVLASFLHPSVPFYTLLRLSTTFFCSSLLSMFSMFFTAYHFLLTTILALFTFNSYSQSPFILCLVDTSNNYSWSLDFVFFIRTRLSISTWFCVLLLCFMSIASSVLLCLVLSLSFTLLALFTFYLTQPMPLSPYLVWILCCFVINFGIFWCFHLPPTLNFRFLLSYTIFVCSFTHSTYYNFL